MSQQKRKEVIQGAQQLLSDCQGFCLVAIRPDGTFALKVMDGEHLEPSSKFILRATMG